MLWAAAVACLGIAAVATASGGWLLGIGPVGVPGRILAGLGGLLLLYLHPVSIATGVALLAATAALALARRRTDRRPPDPAAQAESVEATSTSRSASPPDRSPRKRESS